MFHLSTEYIDIIKHLVERGSILKQKQCKKFRVSNLIFGPDFGKQKKKEQR